MRLAAVFIPKGEQFNNTTINFGGRYNYEIDLISDEIKATRTENKNFIKNFFSDNLKSISAIVGKNGVGKTTLLRKILKDDDLILIFENDNESFLKDWFVASSKEYSDLLVGIKQFKSSTDEIKFSQNDLISKDHFGFSIINQQNNTPTFYYYSPLSNFNLSTKYIDDFIINEDSIFIIKSEILQRQVLFLLQNDLIEKLKGIYDDFPSYQSIKIKLEELINPDITTLDFRFYTFYKNNVFKKNTGLSELEKDEELRAAYILDLEKKDYTDIFSRLSIKSKQSSGRERIYIEIYIRLLLSLFSLTGFRFLNLVLSEINGIIEDKIFGSDEEFNGVVEETIGKVLIITKKNNEIAIVEELKEIRTSIEGILENMPENQNYSSLDKKLNLLYQSYFYFLKLTNLNVSDFTNDFEIPFLKFDTDKNLSQGEEYLLNLFSSIFSKGELGNKKNIILILDEPDLGFHPKWKKKLIYSFIKVLPTLINNITPKELEFESFDNPNKMHFDTLQIIFTTHNPLTLSDIPNDNIIYLDKKDNVFLINNFSRPQKSFGANINDLLADSFFLNDGLIGDFAKEKIESIILKLNYFKLVSEKSKINETDKDWKIISNKINFEIKLIQEKVDFILQESDIENERKENSIFKTINLIGEPVIRYKLLEMYEEIFSDNSKKIRAEKIKRLMEELDLTKDDLEL